MPKKLTKEEFIKKANEKHNGKYDYSKVDYVNNRTKVCIICHKPEHGEFWQTPNSHLSGHECPKCSREKNTSTKYNFIKKAREAHGDKYDYTKVDYVNAHTKVCIICSNHGEFWQAPNDHLKGRGCPKCAHEANGERCRSSKEDFIKKAKEVHKDKYDYTKVEYVNCETNVFIKCPKHGEFWQTPHNHTNGQGCPKCAHKANGERCHLSKEEFIIKAREKHGNKYDYSKVEYVNSLTEVCIICPEHGKFEQMPYRHLQGNGCPKCGIEKVREKLSSSKEEFIIKAREAHGDKYDYSKVEYMNCATKVCIICPQHGEFLQEANSHTQGVGCPKCNLSHLERNVMNYLDEHEIAYDYQKRFNWLGRQSLDFYLPDYNVGIECQGGQHFFPVDFAGKGVEWACKQFDKLISRDKRKKALCEKHGIKLLYFGNVPNYDIFLGEAVHDNVQYLIDYLK